MNNEPVDDAARPRRAWYRWPRTILYVAACAVVVWSVWRTNTTAQQADRLSRDVATLTAQQGIDACQSDNRTREHVAEALNRIVDDVDLITDDPETEKVIADLRAYIRDKLGQVPCAVPATITGG